MSRIWTSNFEKFGDNLLQASAETDLTNWGYGNAYGFTPLREQIQRYLTFERGVHVDIDQIILTSGAQHSIDLIAQALLKEGETVSVEDPGFPAARMTMKYRGMNVVAVPVDEYGVQVEHIDAQTKLILLRLLTNVRLVSLCLSHADNNCCKSLQRIDFGL